MAGPRGLIPTQNGGNRVVSENVTTDENLDHQVRDQIRQFILTNFLFGEESGLPEASASLLKSGVVDSTGVLELVDFLEADLGIEVAAEETLPDNLDSIDNLTRFVMRKRGAAASS